MEQEHATAFGPAGGWNDRRSIAWPPQEARGTSLAAAEAELDARFTALRAGRATADVYAIEHDLDAERLQEIADRFGRLAASTPVAAVRAAPLCAIVLAAETGYRFEGLWAGFWPHFEDSISAAFEPAAREALSEAHASAATRFGLKRPAPTPFARHFRHIAWPLANALVPRQLHAGLAAAIRDVVLLGRLPDDDAQLERALRAAARRTGGERLNEWFEDAARAVLVTRALLDASETTAPKGMEGTTANDAAKDGGHEGPSRQVRERLLADIMRSAAARGPIREAWSAVRSARRPISPARLWWREDHGALLLAAAVPGTGGAQVKLDELDRARLRKAAAELSLVPPSALAPDEPLLLVRLAGTALFGETDAPLPVRADDVRVVASEALPSHAALTLLHSGGMHVYRLDTACPQAADWVDARGRPLEEERGRIGGLALDLGTTYASGVPLALNGVSPCRVRFARDMRAENGPSDDRMGVAAPDGYEVSDGPVALAMAWPGTVRLEPWRREDASSDLAITIVDPASHLPVVGIAVEPVEPTLEDVADGTFGFEIGAAMAIENLPVRATLRVPGRPPIEAEAILPRVPTRLRSDDPLLADMVAALATALPASATLRLDLGVERTTLELQRRDVVTTWHRTPDGWLAERHRGEGEPTVRSDVLSVDENAPLAAPGGPASGDAARLLFLADDVAAGLVVTPTSLRGFGETAAPLLPAHRRFATAGTLAGLEGEIEMSLRWRLADAVNPLGHLARARAAAHGVQAVLTTLCGPAWAALERRTVVRGAVGLATALAAEAMQRDMLEATAMREEAIWTGVPLQAEDELRLERLLAQALRPLLRSAADGSPWTIDAAMAERMDFAIGEAWNTLNSEREARGAIPLDADPGNTPADWNDALAAARAAIAREDLLAMILPADLRHTLRDLDYDAASPAAVAASIAASRVDRGSQRGEGVELSADALANALLMWLAPRAFARLEWRPLARVLLGDRMTARALRYAALRMGAERATEEMM